jgi:hypothetical protein
MPDVSVPVNRETKVLLDALAVLNRKPLEDILHEAVLGMFKRVLSSEPSQAAAPHKITEEEMADHDRLADRIRSFFVQRYLQPARESGKRHFEVQARELNAEMGLEQGYSAVIAALQARSFLKRNRLRLIATTSGAPKILRFEILD